MHSALHDRVLRLGIHHVQNAVDYFISSRPEDGSTEKSGNVTPLVLCGRVWFTETLVALKWT